MASDTPLGGGWPRWPEQRISAVEELTFKNCELSVNSIAHFTNARMILKLFSCKWNGYVGNRSSIDLPVLLLHQSLQSLGLDASGSGYLNMPSTPLRITPLGSLKGFENLKHLRICRRSLSDPLAARASHSIRNFTFITRNLSYS